MRPHDFFPGAEGWVPPSTLEIDSRIKALKESPESTSGADAAKWLAGQAWHAWYGRHEVAWLKTLILVDASLNRTIEWCLQNDPRGAIALTGDLPRYWFLSDGYKIGLPFLKRALEGPFEISRERARAMSGVVDAGLTMNWNMPTDNIQMAQDTIEMYRCADDLWGVAHATWHLGLAYCYASRPKSTMECYWNALTRFREISDPIGQANVLLCIASLPYYETPLGMAHGPEDLDPLTECLELFSTIGNDWGQGVALTMLLSQRRHLSRAQCDVVRTKLLRRATERRAEWDHAGAKDAERLAAELENAYTKPITQDWNTINLN